MSTIANNTTHHKKFKLSFKNFPNTEKPRTLVKNKFFFLPIVINFFIILFIISAKKYIPSEVPLYYGLPSGRQQLAPALALIIPSVSSVVVIILNSLLSLAVKNDFLKQALITSGFVYTLLSAITTLKIILLIGSF